MTTDVDYQVRLSENIEVDMQGIIVRVIFFVGIFASSDWATMTFRDVRFSWNGKKYSAPELIVSNQLFRFAVPNARGRNREEPVDGTL